MEVFDGATPQCYHPELGTVVAYSIAIPPTTYN
jgi:hypothetical protein